jgi:hypothetical protein
VDHGSVYRCQRRYLGLIALGTVPGVRVYFYALRLRKENLLSVTRLSKYWALSTLLLKVALPGHVPCPYSKGCQSRPPRGPRNLDSVRRLRPEALLFPDLSHPRRRYCHGPSSADSFQHLTAIGWYGLQNSHNLVGPEQRSTAVTLMRLPNYSRLLHGTDYGTRMTYTR